MGYVGQAPAAGSVTTSEITDGTIANVDIASDAAIAMSKTALVGGTNITLATNTLNVDDAFLTNTGNDTTSGVLTVSNSTAASATNTGAFVVTGGIATGGDIWVGDDIVMDSDSAVLSLGDGQDVTLTHDGTTGATLAGNPLELDSGGTVTLDSASGIFIFQDGSTEVLRITEGNSGDVTVKLAVNAKDLIFTDNGDATGLTVKDAAAGIVVPGEVMTTKISYTDGDDAITIADGGGTTFAQAVDLGSNTLTSTGSMQIQTIDYSDGDLAMTIADGGGVTFAQNATFSGNVTLADDKVINLGEAGKIDFGDEAPADNAATGIVFSFIAGATLAIGDVVYIHTDGEVAKADADAVTSMPAVGICVSSGSDGSAVDVLVQGIMHDTSAFATFTVGADIFVGTTAGAVTATAPSGSGDTVQKVGVALHADMVYFNFNTTEVLLA